jgi:hypothetical protein
MEIKSSASYRKLEDIVNEAEQHKQQQHVAYFNAISDQSTSNDRFEGNCVTVVKQTAIELNSCSEKEEKKKLKSILRKVNRLFIIILIGSYISESIYL